MKLLYSRMKLPHKRSLPNCKHAMAILRTRSVDCFTDQDDAGLGPVLIRCVPIADIGSLVWVLSVVGGASVHPM